jgi:copper(I)-binding protein
VIRSRRSAGRSRVALAALVTAGGVVLAGCAAGQQAQTAEQRPTIDGNNAEVGPLALRNVAIEYPDNGVYRKGSVARLRLVIANTGNESDELTEVRTDVAGEVSLVGAQTQDDSSPSASPAETGSATPTETGSATPTETGSATPTATGSASPTEGPGGTPSGTATVTATESPAASPSETGPLPGTTVTILPNNAVSIGQGTAEAAILLRGLTQDLRSSQVVSITFVFRSAGSVTVPVPVADPSGEVAPAPTISAEPEE